MIQSILKIGTELSKNEQRVIHGGVKIRRCCNPSLDCCDPASYPSDCLAYGDPNAFPVPYCM
jgi:hypothetical protein